LPLANVFLKIKKRLENKKTLKKFVKNLTKIKNVKNGYYIYDMDMSVVV